MQSSLSNLDFELYSDYVPAERNFMKIFITQILAIEYIFTS